VQRLGLDGVQHALVVAVGERVDEQLPQRAEPVVGRQRLLERARWAIDGQELVDLLDRETGPGRELPARRVDLTVGYRRAVRVMHASEGAQGPVRERHRPAELGDELLHGLTHPPARVGPERRAAGGIEALERPEQADHPLLEQLRAFDVRAPVVPRKTRDRAGERLHEPSASGRVAVLGGQDEPALLAGGQPRAPLQLVEVSLDPGHGLIISNSSVTVA
jgi:hypothetical protein